MTRRLHCILLLLLILVTASFSQIKIASGYDEGISLKLGFTEKISAYASLGYRSFTADSVYHQPINSYWGKLGGTLMVKEFGRLKLNLFLELGTLIQNLETEQLSQSGNGSTLRYNTFDIFSRIGAYPEFLITDHISVGYKIGFEGIYKDNHFELDEAGTGLKDKKDDHFVTGLFAAGSSMFDDRNNSPISGLFAHNFVLFINF